MEQLQIYDHRAIEYGIAFQDWIICATSGSSTSIEFVLNSAKSLGISEDDAIVELEWIDFKEKIK